MQKFEITCTFVALPLLSSVHKKQTEDRWRKPPVIFLIGTGGNLHYVCTLHDIMEYGGKGRFCVPMTGGRTDEENQELGDRGDRK